MDRHVLKVAGRGVARGRRRQPQGRPGTAVGQRQEANAERQPGLDRRDAVRLALVGDGTSYLPSGA